MILPAVVFFNSGALVKNSPTAFATVLHNLVFVYLCVLCLMQYGFNNFD